MDVVRLLNDEEDRREIVRTSLESRKVLEGSEMFGLVSVMYTYFFRERERGGGLMRERIDYLDINILNCGIIYVEMM